MSGPGEIVNQGKKDCASRKRIVEAALKLFSRKGFCATGLRELSTEAEVNLAMVSYFFGSKKGLLKELLDRFFSGYLAIARETLSGSDPVEVRLRRFIGTTLAYFQSNRSALLVALAEIPHDDPDIIEHKTRWARQMMAQIDRHLCRPIARQHGHSIPPRVLAPLLTATLASRFLFAPLLEQLDSSRKSLLDPTIIEQLTVVLLHGLLPEPQDKTGRRLGKTRGQYANGKNKGSIRKSKTLTCSWNA